jgi:DUF2075 family protein
MILYKATKKVFCDDVVANDIADKIQSSFKEVMGYATGRREFESWRSSMLHMHNVLLDIAIPDDAGIAIEYKIPQTSKRVDFIVTGKESSGQECAILVELKQWSEATLTGKDGVIVSYVGGREREVAHPSYQAWTYASLLNDFNQVVVADDIQLFPCAYLHNYEQEDVITNSFYDEYLQKAPVFLKRDTAKLTQFMKQHIKYGDSGNIMYRIDHGKIKPSKNLADELVSMIKGNQEFLMIDDQKVVYETALKLATESSETTKHILIVEGGPGTGKSVVAINLLVELSRRGLLTQYVTKNAAPRAVYESKLTGSFRKSQISNLFSNSGSFMQTDANLFDVLVVDEAHRLNEKSGIFQNLGENQVKEIIAASKFSIFFLDEDQKVTFQDIGEKEEIKRWATAAGATVHEMALTSQFRCNGSDGYLAWLDDALQVRDTANTSLEGINYDFKIVDSPSKLRQLIVEKNKANNKARMVAGICWEWPSRKDPDAYDVVMPEFDFAMRWNLTTDGGLWIVKKESINEIGCIHTCQGLEVDYVGVIIGPDFIVRNGEVVTDAAKRGKIDKTIRGYKKLFASDPELAKAKADLIIKNTYRTLMTRGQKGCYVYFTDEETANYFKKRLNNED